ncbi:MAG: nitroreductase [Firmicutes bacterium]|nr:nitroreductase [Bacillota bacterium]
MYEIIQKRKSIRKYDLTPVDTAILEKVQAQIDKVKPLYPDIKYSVEIVNKIKGVFNNVRAPHYLIFGSEEKEGSLENIGFIGQQLNLYFAESGLGCCWLGGAKSQGLEASALPYVICMAFGKPAEPLHRILSEFKRKPLQEISQGNDDRLEACRLAPSAVNAQNWYFIAEKGKIHCYRKKSDSLLGFIYNRLHCIDMGIALYHIAIESENFNFVKENDITVLKEHIYMGTVG